MEENKNLKKFDIDSLPSFFNDLTKEQQSIYLEKLAMDNADLKKLAGEKMIKSKIAANDMDTDIEFLSRIETDNKVVSVKREYQTGSGNLVLNLKGGDKKFLIPILIVAGLIVIAILLSIFH